MKTISIYQDEALRRRIIILILVLFPVLSFAMMPKSNGNHSSDSNQFVAIQTEKMLEWKTDISSRSIELPSNIELEEKLIIEKWMLDVKESFWYDEEKEEEIQVEDWMYNYRSESWMPNRDEEEFEIETWMCNPSSWLHAH